MPLATFRHLILLTLLAALAPPAVAQADSAGVVSARLGPELSAAERAYFGLFPSVAAFASARLVPAGGGLRVEVARTGGLADTALVLGPAAARALVGFAETFEQHRSAFLNPHWQQVSRFADPAVPVPFVDAHAANAVAHVGGDRFPGVILLATDTLLVMQPVRPYRWREPGAVAYRPGEVERVELPAVGTQRLRVAPLALGGALGAAVAAAAVLPRTNAEGGTATSVGVVAVGVVTGALLARRFWFRPPAPASYAERRAALEERAAFRAGVPYDFGDPRAYATADARAQLQAEDRRREAPLWWRWRERYGWVSLGFGAAGTVGDRPGAVTFTEQYRGRTGTNELLPYPHTNLVNEVEHQGAVDLSLRPVPWVRLGATWDRLEADVARPTSASDPDDRELLRTERAYTTPGTFRTYAELVLPSPRFGGVGVDLALGAGFETNEVVVERAAPGSPGPPVLNEGDSIPAAYSYEVSGRNAFQQATFEVFTTRYTSVYLRYTRRTLPVITVEAVEVERAQQPGQVQYQMDEHTVESGYSLFTWGTRFHF